MECMCTAYHSVQCTAYHSVQCTSCLCTLSVSAFMHWDIPTSARFLFSVYGDLFLIKLKWCHPRASGWCVIRARVHRQMASNLASNSSAPSVFPARKRKTVTLKSKLKLTITTHCYFYWRLLDELLDASVSSPAMISLWKRSLVPRLFCAGGKK